MDATELRKENEKLKEALAQAVAQLQESQLQREATAQQFSETLDEKERQVNALQHQIKLLLARIRGSRQERIDPDQLLLFSIEELEEIARQMKLQPGDDELLDDDPPKKRRKRTAGRVGKLPDHLARISHSVNDSSRPFAAKMLVFKDNFSKQKERLGHDRVYPTIA